MSSSCSDMMLMLAASGRSILLLNIKIGPYLSWLFLIFMISNNSFLATWSLIWSLASTTNIIPYIVYGLLRWTVMNRLSIVHDMNIVHSYQKWCNWCFCWKTVQYCSLQLVRIPNRFVNSISISFDGSM